MKIIYFKFAIFVFLIISVVISIIIIFSIITTLKTITGIWLLILVISPWIVGSPFLIFLIFHSTLLKFEANVKSLEKEQNYCYHCGEDLKKYEDINECPKCNSMLKYHKFLIQI